MRSTAPVLTIDDLAIILACLCETRITDACEQQFALQIKLSQTLSRNAAEHYQALVDAGKIPSIEDLEQERDLNVQVGIQKAIARDADRVDGYDRDDLGESPDY